MDGDHFRLVTLRGEIDEFRLNHGTRRFHLRTTGYYLIQPDPYFTDRPGLWSYRDPMVIRIPDGRWAYRNVHEGDFESRFKEISPRTVQDLFDEHGGFVEWIERPWKDQFSPPWEPVLTVPPELFTDQASFDSRQSIQELCTLLSGVTAYLNLRRDGARRFFVPESVHKTSDGYPIYAVPVVNRLPDGRWFLCDKESYPTYKEITPPDAALYFSRREIIEYLRDGDYQAGIHPEIKVYIYNDLDVLKQDVAAWNAKSQSSPQAVEAPALSGNAPRVIVEAEPPPTPTGFPCKKAELLTAIGLSSRYTTYLDKLSACGDLSLSKAEKPIGRGCYSFLFKDPKRQKEIVDVIIENRKDRSRKTD